MRKAIPLGVVDYETLKNQNYFFIDKSMMIYDFLMRKSTVTLITRPRRFGKTINMSMMSSFFDITKDSKEIFKDTKIVETEYISEMNQYPTIFISFANAKNDKWNVVKEIKLQLRKEYDRYAHVFEQKMTVFEQNEYESLVQGLMTKNDGILDNIIDALSFLMERLEKYYHKKVMVFIDEYDTPFIEAHVGGYYEELRGGLSSLLHNALKTSTSLHYAMMTGIQRVAKENIFSDLNNLVVCTVKDPEYSQYFGFTEEEVKKLCEEYAMNFEEAKAWYNGYGLISHSRLEDRKYSIYSPKSVVEAMLRHKFGTYWNRTETYEALKIYIQMNMDGLKDSVIQMLAGEGVRINTGTFSNDMTTFATKDDVLTLLVHLGYLTYNSETEKVTIPNKEVSQEYLNAISTMDWHEVMRSVENSRKLVEALWNQDAKAVAAGIENVHDEISILQYHDENSLSCTIHLAFYFAREYYTIIRELPTGKGFADICMIPRKIHADKPAVIIELKWDKDAEGAIAQIKEKKYVKSLEDYKGNLLLAGINYDKKTKTHTCVIEKVEL